MTPDTMYKRRTSSLRPEYSEIDVRSMLNTLHDGAGDIEGIAWEPIAALFDDQINRATLSAYARGRPVVNPDHRRILRIKPRSVPRSERPPTKEIRLDDAESGAISLLNSEASDEYLARLSELLDILKR